MSNQKQEKELCCCSCDHRTVGKNKGFFYFSKEIGSGFSFWASEGYKLREIIKRYINDFQRDICGINLVQTPILGKTEIYQKTGHLPLYDENIFPAMKKEGEEWILRPMTCPHHILLAKEVIMSYKQLPYLMGENSCLHRYEYSGGLLGLKRVRAMELIDTHIFVLPEHCKDMIKSSLEWVWTLLNKFRIRIKEIVLATRSSKQKYLISGDEWNQTEEILFSATKEWIASKNISVSLVRKEGEAAFYGPKIDFNAVDSSNQEFTISTVQLDSQMPKKLEFSILYANQNSINPWIIHLGLIGTLERFIAYLLEDWGGKLPFWLLPTQISILTVRIDSSRHELNELIKKFSSYGFRAKLDLRDERISKKIVNAVNERIPFQIIIGEKELQNLDLINFRELGKEGEKQLSFSDFINYLSQEEVSNQVF
ncbi:aminoacyl--tRNA ligase-related protein [Mycoplasma suis]|uniref:threonine--tRNA ligase n=1 Tax=Mycoplasma suis (strain Illinois) TaxID=768700 RepID=F0QS78_MYCSL|nr:aminoacyl--tRNA ligase-related protein [Mycoplasma suis]ADX98348.1 threonyl-tRNA synthetase [Mycoplasma suis str. Illinois]